jgi:hypothetical protein
MLYLAANDYHSVSGIYRIFDCVHALFTHWFVTSYRMPIGGDRKSNGAGKQAL